MSKIKMPMKPVYVKILLPGEIHQAAKMKAVGAGQKFKDWLKQAITDCAKAE